MDMAPLFATFKPFTRVRFEVFRDKELKLNFELLGRTFLGKENIKVVDKAFIKDILN